MNLRSIANSLVVCAIMLVVFATTPSRGQAQEEDNGYSNLRVLPENISRSDLGAIMQANSRGLGLPRRQGEGCLYCHVGDMETPRGEWDYASDSKPEKIRARAMLQMVADINGRHLAGIDDRVAPDLEVSCYTCHAGRTDPRPLPELLWNAYGEAGIDGLIDEYQRLRERYFGADAYDFRPHVLEDISTELADQEEFGDALILARVNAEINADQPNARTNWLRIELERTAASNGIEAALLEFETFKATESEDAVNYGLLDWMGWRMWRADKKEEATRLFEKNLTEFPDVYIPRESMASVLRAQGDWDAAIGMFEDWLETHPDHSMARAQLINYRARRDRARR
jgi:tetratricopeptide (TPR) repeat protein